MFKSKTAFMMESTEKIIDAMGIDGKQATLHKLFVTHLEVKCSFQGKVTRGNAMLTNKMPSKPIFVLKNFGNP